MIVDARDKKLPLTEIADMMYCQAYRAIEEYEEAAKLRICVELCRLCHEPAGEDHVCGDGS